MTDKQKLHFKDQVLKFSSKNKPIVKISLYDKLKAIYEFKKDLFSEHEKKCINTVFDNIDSLGNDFIKFAKKTGKQNVKITKKIDVKDLEYFKIGYVLLARLHTIIEETKTKLEKYPQSAHLIDQKLKHNFARDNGTQPSLFDVFLPDPEKKIEKEEIITEGINLTPKQDQILNAISQLLYEKSDTRKENNIPKNIDTYFRGNFTPTLVKYGKNDKPAPVLKFKALELYKLVTSKDHPSGSEIKIINNALIGLAVKQHGISYTRQYKKSGKTLYDVIRETQSLIKIYTISEGINKVEVKNPTELGVKNEKHEIILLLNPIFMDQIADKFVLFPKNINKLTTDSYNGTRAPESVYKLRDYMLRLISNKIKNNSINKDKLIYQLGLEKMLKAGKQKRVNERIKESFETVLNMNLITKWKEVTGSAGQLKYDFTINEDFFK